MSELREMPSSLNDACRKLDAAYAEIERLRSLLAMSYPDQMAEIDRLQAELGCYATEQVRLRTALEPFAMAAEIIAKRPDDYPDCLMKVGGLSDVHGIHKREFSRAFDVYQQQRDRK